MQSSGRCWGLAAYGGERGGMRKRGEPRVTPNSGALVPKTVLSLEVGNT